MTRRRVFARFFLCLLVAQLGLAAASWMMLNWGIHVWLRNKGAQLADVAVEVAAGFQAAEVDSIPSGDTTSAAFASCLERLQAQEKRCFPRGDATMALFAVMPGPPRPWLAMRVAEYPPYVPDDGTPPPSQSQNDLACILKVIGGQACFSPAPYGGTEPGEPVVLSGYAPIHDETGAVKAVLAVDGNVGPLSTLQEATRTAFLVALVPAFLISAGLAGLLTARFVDPVDFFKGVQEAAVQRQDAPTPPSPFLTAVNTRWDSLTEREKEVVRYIGQALSPRDIAALMVVQESTVKQHLKNVHRKLDLHSREELVIFSVYKFGFIVDDRPQGES